MIKITEFSTLYFNIIKACIGTGILGFPYIFQFHGIIYALAFSVAASLASLFGCYIYMNLNEKYGKNSTMATLSKHIFPPLQHLVNAVVVVKCIMVTIAYFSFIKKTAKTVLFEMDIEALTGISLSTFVKGILLSVALLLIVPVMSESLNSLKSLSFLGAVGMMILFVGTFLVSSGHTSKDVLLSKSLNLKETIGLFVFGFNCHQNIFAIHNESRLKLSSIKIVFILSIATVCLLYTGFGYMNYRSFSNIPEDILLAWPSSKAKNITALTYCSIVGLTIPFQVHPARNHLFDFLGLGGKSKKFIGLSILLGVTALTTFKDISFHAVAKLVSNSLSTMMCFLFPSFYLFFDKGKKGPGDLFMSLYLIAFAGICLYSFFSQVLS